VVGGIIPPADAASLLAQGVAAVFTPADFGITAIIGRIVEVIRQAHKLKPQPAHPAHAATGSAATIEG
jgi:ethylmalonyl-CoA mutase